MAPSFLLLAKLIESKKVDLAISMWFKIEIQNIWEVLFVEGPPWNWDKGKDKVLSFRKELETSAKEKKCRTLLILFCSHSLRTAMKIIIQSETNETISFESFENNKWSLRDENLAICLALEACWSIWLINKNWQIHTVPFDDYQLCVQQGKEHNDTNWKTSRKYLCINESHSLWFSMLFTRRWSSHCND